MGSWSETKALQNSICDRRVVRGEMLLQIILWWIFHGIQLGRIHSLCTIIDNPSNSCQDISVWSGWHSDWLFAMPWAILSSWLTKPTMCLWWLMKNSANALFLNRVLQHVQCPVQGHTCTTMLCYLLHNCLQHDVAAVKKNWKNTSCTTA